MKAAIYANFGTANEVLKIQNTDKPEPGHGEVLVGLKASGVNPSDVKKRAGSNPDALNQGPIIPHSDGSGVIKAVGTGVPESRLDERVWIFNGQFGRQNGTAAEYISVPSNQAIRLPDNVGFVEGACIGIPMMTAHRCVFADGPVEGQNILITGGAGRVGHYAIQLAKHGGANVLATASSEESKKHCLEAGADIVIDHPHEGSVLQIMELTGGEKIDRVVEGEFGGNLEYLLDALKTGATIATYASMGDPNPSIPFYKMMYLDLTVRLVIVYAMPDNAKSKAIEEINELLSQDQLIHRVVKKYKLKDIARAHELIEEGKVRGCAVVTMT